MISSERRLGHFLHIEENGKGNQGGDKQRTKGGSLFAYRREGKREPGGGDKQRNKASAEGAE